jgi:branched-chain amino acid transport system substrate-binding protein
MKNLKFLLVLTFLLSSLSATAEPLSVAVVVPLTGPVAEYGVASQNGFILAQEEHPEQLKNIKFIFDDSQYDPKVALTIYKKLRANPEVKILYNWGSNPSAPLIPLAEKDCFPLVTLDFSSEMTAGKKCVLSFSNSTTELGTILAAHLQKKGFKKLAVVKVENAYINGMLDGLRKGFKEVEVVGEFDPGFDDFNSIVTKLKTKKFDALGIFLYAGQISSFYRQMKALRYDLPTFGTDFFESSNEIRQAGESMQGAVYAHLTTDVGFTERYRKRFGNDDQIASAGGAYDFALLVAKLFGENKKELTHQEIIRSLKESGQQEGVLGTYSFSDSSVDGPRFRFPIVMKKVKGATFEVISE